MSMCERESQDGDVHHLTELLALKDLADLGRHGLELGVGSKYLV